MLFTDFLVMIFSAAIALSLISMIPSVPGLGNDYLAVGIIIFSLLVIFLIKAPKKNYRPTPSHREG
jgi:hypothetical protein